MSIQTKTKTLGIYSITSALLIAAALASPAYASKGGNGPGNGTDDYANSLALKKLMDNRDGLTIEEKLYDLWVRAEGSVLDINNPDNLYTWFGLNVANLGDPTPPDYSGTKKAKSKYQKELLIFKSFPALMAGEFEIKPSQTFAYNLSTGNYNGDMNPRHTEMGNIGTNIYLYGDDYPYEGREDVNKNSSNWDTIKPVKVLDSGVLVSVTDNYRDKFAPVEYRQIDANTLVGVRKVRTEPKDVKPCPDAREVKKTVKVMVGVKVDGFFGPRTVQQESTHEVLDHWELAKDYGVPGICEIHYLFKTKDHL
ncbi:MAG: hypothetical protein ACJ763_14320 [Bdellovibrionia bacterium]